MQLKKITAGLFHPYNNISNPVSKSYCLYIRLKIHTHFSLLGTPVYTFLFSEYIAHIVNQSTFFVIKNLLHPTGLELILQNSYILFLCSLRGRIFSKNFFEIFFTVYGNKAHYQS